MSKSTNELLETLKRSPSIIDYLVTEDENLVSASLSDCMNFLITRKSLDKSTVIQHSGLQRNYAYQILSGERKNPSRNKVLALCFGMHLTLEETQSLLKCTNYPALYPRIERDCVIIYALQRSHSVGEVNELLFEMNFEIIE